MRKFGKRRQKAYLEALRGGARRGAAAVSVGITRQTVWMERTRNPEFAKAEEDAEMEANELVENALFQAAQSGNVTAAQVWLYNRMPERWQDKRNIQHTGKDGGPIGVANLSDAEIDARLAKILTAGGQEGGPGAAVGTGAAAGPPDPAGLDDEAPKD
jgi:hypothetical protein